MTGPGDATVFPDLTGEVEIPREGTLSRVLFRGDGLRVVIFGFDAGGELTEHAASVPAVAQVLFGRLHLVLGEQEVEAAPGAWIHIPARLPHRVLALQPSVMVLSMFDDGSPGADE